MSKILRYITLTGLAFIIVSCATPKTMFEGMSKKHWLIGAWKDTKGHTTEEWKYIDKNTITGRMYSAVSRDTLTVQTYKLERRGKEVLFNATMMENVKTFSKFKLKSETSNTLEFENSEDGFPKKISYVLNSPTSMTEVIEGMEEGGEFKKREFSFTKAAGSVNKK
jgi:hypothetical protein